MKNSLSVTAFAASAFALFALSNSANAATYTITDVANGPIASAILPGPPIVNSPVVLYPATGTGCIGSNCFRDPFEGTGLAGSPYLSVGANGSATYTGFGPADTLKLLWGSVDQYNGIEFTGGTLGDVTIKGSDAQLYPITAPGAGHDFVTIAFTDPGAFFTSVTFFNNPGIDAFEMDNLSACTGLGEVCRNLDNGLPIPAALPLFASGLAGFGGLLGWRRKKKAQASAVAA
jgi:hypothetical protein